MKILVTGGAGFIGANFILYWLEKYPQDSIVNLDKLTYAGNLESLRSLEGNRQYRFVQGDITDSALVEKLVAEVDLVVHFAAETHVDRSISGPAVFINTNVVGTQVLLDAAVKFKLKRFHHVSTDEVYGSLNLDDKNKFNEKTAYNPQSPYAASKAAADHLVRAYINTYGLSATISNCSNNFGPFQFPEKFIPLVITNLLEGKKAPIYGDGLHVRDWLYVSDHCRALDLIIHTGAAGETYCIGGLTDNINNLEVARKIIAIMGFDEKMLAFVADRPGHDRRYALDWTKIKKELGFQPENNFDVWLEKTVIWYKDHQAWWQKLKK